MAEDKAGQEVLRAAERAEAFKRMKVTLSAPRFVVEFTPRFDVPVVKVDMGLSRENERYLQYAHGLPCKSEDDHVFDSTGQCSLCGAHRKPA